MRVQHTAIHVPKMKPQFHVACAQLKVTGGGQNLPPKNRMIKIPGAFRREDPGYNVNIFVDFKEYKAPGGEVWTC